MVIWFYKQKLKRVCLNLCLIYYDGFRGASVTAVQLVQLISFNR